MKNFLENLKMIGCIGLIILFFALMFFLNKVRFTF